MAISAAIIGALGAAARVGDPFYNSVSLLLHMDGANNGSVFTDNSPNPKTPTLLSSPVTVTDDYKFAPSSFLGDGTSATTGRCLNYASHADFNILTGDFTLEFFFKSYNNSQDAGIVSLGDVAAVFGISATSGKILFRPGGTSVLALTGAVDSAWHHVAFSRQSGTLRGFVDGVLKGTVANSTSYGQSNLVVGAWSSQSATRYGCNGRLDEVRLTKGISRYNAAFTAPTSPFPNSI